MQRACPSPPASTRFPSLPSARRPVYDITLRPAGTARCVVGVHALPPRACGPACDPQGSICGLCRSSSRAGSSSYWGWRPSWLGRPRGTGRLAQRPRHPQGSPDQLILNFPGVPDAVPIPTEGPGSGPSMDIFLTGPHCGCSEAHTEQPGSKSPDFTLGGQAHPSLFQCRDKPARKAQYLEPPMPLPAWPPLLTRLGSEVAGVPNPQGRQGHPGG